MTTNTTRITFSAPTGDDVTFSVSRVRDTDRYPGATARALVEYSEYDPSASSFSDAYPVSEIEAAVSDVLGRRVRFHSCTDVCETGEEWTFTDVRSWEIVTTDPAGAVGDRILWSTRARAEAGLANLIVTTGWDEDTLKIVERDEVPDAGF